jgi:hypothetical protein
MLSQKNVAPQVVKKLPVDFMGQISRMNKMIIGINKFISEFIF